MSETDDQRPPPLTSFLRELPNLTFIWSSPVRPVRLDQPARKAAHDAAPVLVFPGILSADPATSLMRRTLRASGYYAYASRLGVVTGMTPQLVASAEARLEYIFAKHQRPVTLIGISLGGFYARVLGQRHPEKVNLVMTLGTPFSGDRRANNAWRVYEAINDHSVDNPPFADDPKQKPGVRTIAIWSPRDGIIAPACSRGEEGERDIAIEVPETHFEFSASRRSINRILGILEDHAD
ncbi:MAG: YqiA/YcfP family alpha/beta fold hydrolase [Pseudomonadota bacterium]